jgi:hypothetical protein
LPSTAGFPSTAVVDPYALVFTKSESVADVGLQHGQYAHLIWSVIRKSGTCVKWARERSWTGPRVREIDLLSVVIDRLTNEGVSMAPDSGLACLLMRLTAMEAIEGGATPGYADALEDNALHASLVPRKAKTEAAAFADKQRRLKAAVSGKGRPAPDDDDDDDGGAGKSRRRRK